MGSSPMTRHSHEFFGRTDNPHPAPQLLTHPCYSPRDLCVCQVLAIPGQEIINGVNGRHRDVDMCHTGDWRDLGVPTGHGAVVLLVGLSSIKDDGPYSMGTEEGLSPGQVAR